MACHCDVAMHCCGLVRFCRQVIALPISLAWHPSRVHAPCQDLCTIPSPPQEWNTNAGWTFDEAERSSIMQGMHSVCSLPLLHAAHTSARLHSLPLPSRLSRQLPMPSTFRAFVSITTCSSPRCARAANISLPTCSPCHHFTTSHLHCIVQSDRMHIA